MHPRKLIGYGVCLIALIGATSWVMAQEGKGPRKPLERRLLYATTPGATYAVEDISAWGGHGIVVYDAGQNFGFVKRIPTQNPKAHEDPWRNMGATASPHTGLMYMFTTEYARNIIDGRTPNGGTRAFDLRTEQLVWEQNYDTECCDRGEISPDGKILYVPSYGAHTTNWYVVDPMTGRLLKRLLTPETRGSHNTVFSADSKRAYLASLSSPTMSVVDTATHTVIQTIKFSDNIRPHVVNGDATYVFANVNNLLGFEVADLKTGKMIHRVEVPGYTWKGKEPLFHGCPSHGLALTPDGREIWVADSANDSVHVFDSTVMPPKYKSSVKLRTHVGWITVGLDGKYVYPSSLDIIDAATKKIVTSLKDERGNMIRSEKLFEVLFSDHKPVRVAPQFSNGFPAPSSMTSAAQSSR